MGLKQTKFFANSSYEAEDAQIIICRQCSSHLCLSSLILSDNFVGSSGPAYLVDRLINYYQDPEIVETSMKTGSYLISHVQCHQCATKLGWVYRKAYDCQQTYKEGKFVIEEEFIKSIANNSSTASLLENMKKTSRRRSSANSTFSSDLSEEDSFRFEKSNHFAAGKGNGNARISHLSFQAESDESFFNRLRFRTSEVEKLDDIEDEAVIDV